MNGLATARLLSVMLVFACLGGCGQPEEKGTWRAGEGVDQVETSGLPTLTLVDVDPDTPTSRARKIRPLADYIAAALEWEPARVRIVIAGSIDDVAVMMLEEEVDLFVDSTFPSLIVQQQAASRVILQSLVDGQKFYSSYIVVSADSEVRELSDLKGQMIAFQEEYSTSGYLLPAALLIDRGFTLVSVLTPDDISAEEIGFEFSGDEENTLAMIREGLVMAGALSSQDYDQLPDEVKDEFRILAQSVEVPRKLASIRDGFDIKLLDRLQRALLAIDDSDREAMVSAGGWNWEFEEIDARSRNGLVKIAEMIEVIEALEQQ